MNVKQYPHYLFICSLADSQQNADGTWTEQTAADTLYTACREESNGKGSELRLQDGNAVVYSSTVFMPKTAARIAQGTEVYVCETSDSTGYVRIRKKVIKFDVGQLSCKLWL